MHTSNYNYYHNEQELHGFLAYDESNKNPRPAVLVAHDWSGRNDFACDKARLLAEMGYVGFALDMYGEGKMGKTTDEKVALMTPLANDRQLLRDRVTSALDAIKEIPQVDKDRIAIIGFCFGGMCALDLARSGAAILGAVSFHGILGKPPKLKSETMHAKILALHGYDDPMAKPDQLREFCDEMTQAKIDWQVHAYGHVQHAFTNPAAHDQQSGLVFNAKAAQRSWLSMRHFFEEIF